MSCFVQILLLTIGFAAAYAQVEIDKKNDNIYEMGYKLSGQHHRYEKKDEKGIVTGEYGFITADGTYHITMYATDKNGNFKILSKKKIKVGLRQPGREIETYIPVVNQLHRDRRRQQKGEEESNQKQRQPKQSKEDLVLEQYSSESRQSAAPNTRQQPDQTEKSQISEQTNKDANTIHQRNNNQTAQTNFPDQLGTTELLSRESGETKPKGNLQDSKTLENTSQARRPSVIELPPYPTEYGDRKNS